jgi:hypothetical protein
MEFMFSEGTEGKHQPEKDKDVEMEHMDWTKDYNNWIYNYKTMLKLNL